MKKILSCAIRGRSDGDWYTSEHRQCLEIGNDVSNAVTSVTKDCLLIEIYEEIQNDAKSRR